MIISQTAKRQWATLMEDCDDMEGTYYVNCYFDEGEGFTRRDTVLDGLTKKEAERVVKSLNRAMSFFSKGN